MWTIKSEKLTPYESKIVFTHDECSHEISLSDEYTLFVLWPEIEKHENECGGVA